MSPRKKRATLARTTRRPYVDDATWDSADDIAASDALTVGHLLTVLLDRYAAGVVDVPLPEEDVRAGGRSGHLAAIGDAAWVHSDERRAREGIQSMSVLCELLLRETVAGRVSAGLDAAPRAQPQTEPREEAAGAVTPSLLHPAA
ncbi:hypothetical protein M5362_11380 [Streptomyces sp. Je 1-79]|uniref:hypothetical protein n=1 Tax=Streptomyces sp. Je 1-79 TaxID=2943847 RepID=UPI0021A82EB7|nr:hypothetical protein [Streptomyces sp. Je 1-79]MCT4353731.1 hypothetical protein [Streptomyces sp. Je 1-79]